MELKTTAFKANSQFYNRIKSDHTDATNHDSCLHHGGDVYLTVE